jgi:hypothetical protein
MPTIFVSKNFFDVVIKSQGHEHHGGGGFNYLISFKFSLTSKNLLMKTLLIAIKEFENILPATRYLPLYS